MCRVTLWIKRPSSPTLFRIYLYGWARPGAVESEAASGAASNGGAAACWGAHNGRGSPWKQHQQHLSVSVQNTRAPGSIDSLWEQIALMHWEPLWGSGPLSPGPPCLLPSLPGRRQEPEWSRRCTGLCLGQCHSTGSRDVIPRQVKAGQKVSIKDRSKDKKSSDFHRFTLPHYSQRHFDLDSSVAIITERWLMQTHFPLRLGHQREDALDWAPTQSCLPIPFSAQRASHWEFSFLWRSEVVDWKSVSSRPCVWSCHHGKRLLYQSRL